MYYCIIIRICIYIIYISHSFSLNSIRSYNKEARLEKFNGILDKCQKGIKKGDLIGESIDDNFLEEHYKILGDFIIKNNELNKIEEIKILKFMQNDPCMARAFANNNKSAITNSMTSTFRADDGYKPLHRPTTPMSNLSMTGTSLIYKNNNYKENEYDSNKIKIPEDSAKAFMKKV